MSFRDIRGQDSSIEFLRNSIESNKVSHAYIFTGPSGVGKRSTAVNFAKALNCLDAKDGDPCDACAQCRKIDASNHPDVLIFSPAREDSSLGIDKIRAVTKDIGLRPYEGRKKVYILDSADSMTQEAQNALLKTLEEPPSDSVLILIAENINALFPTVRSRARKIRFFQLSGAEVRNILVDKYNVDNDRAEILSRISSGEPARAIKYNDEAFFEKRGRIIDALRNGTLVDSDLDGFSKPDLRLALDIILTWYRDILIAKTGGGLQTLINVDKSDLVKDEAQKTGFDELNSIINQVILTSSFLDQNINPKLAMGVLAINITRRNVCMK